MLLKIRFHLRMKCLLLTLHIIWLILTFLLLPSEFYVNKFLSAINSKHRNIKFIVKREENNSLSFLDINIFRDSGKFETQLDRKPTFSGSLIIFESFLTISYKYNLVSTLIYGVFMICSSYIALHFETWK